MSPTTNRSLLAMPNADPVVKAAVLAEALPYMRRYAGHTLVVKYGGHAMGDAAGGDSFARDVVLLKQVGINPIVVPRRRAADRPHATAARHQTSIVDGLRVTDRETMEVVEMVLAGTINKQLVSAIKRRRRLRNRAHRQGWRADRGEKAGAHSIRGGCQDRDRSRFVGEPQRIAAKVLDTFRQSDIIPVIAPIGVGSQGETYNINADTVAGAVAAAVKATRLLLLTDVAGVLDADKNLISELTAATARRLIAEGVINGGMIPKIETCLEAVDGGVDAAVIVDGRVPHAILLELFTEGAGTLIRAG